MFPEIFLASLSQSPQKIGDVEWFTNSTLFAVIVVAVIVTVVQIGLRNLREVPRGVQNFFEWLIEFAYEFLEAIVGKHMIAKTFSVLATLFIFIAASNFFSLLPGVGTIGWGVEDAHGHFHMTTPILRAPNADLNMTLSLALMFMVVWVFWTIREVGLWGFIKHLFFPKINLEGFGVFSLWILKSVLGIVFFAVGIIEVVSISLRSISLSIRLYGNVFAGESLLHAMGGAVDNIALASLISLPFYFLEILVALLQGVVFMLLCAVYVKLSTSHDEDEEHEVKTLKGGEKSVA